MSKLSITVFNFIQIFSQLSREIYIPISIPQLVHSLHRSLDSIVQANVVSFYLVSNTVSLFVPRSFYDLYRRIKKYKINQY